MKRKNDGINASNKINKFIKWYSKNSSQTEKKEHKKNIRDFIEKMAVWYELRYPDYEVTQKFEKVTTNENITNNIFNNNPYTSNIFKNSINELNLKWEDFYNFEAFYISLSKEEKKFLDEPRYPGLLYLGNNSGMHFHLNSDGIVDKYEIIQLKHYGIEVKDYHIKELVKLLKEKGIDVPVDGEVTRAINFHDKKCYIRNSLLDCVMYRIIERGGNKIGLRRAFLFAKEFDRNMEMLCNYAINSNDYSLLLSISEHFQLLGKEDIAAEEVFKKHLKLTNLY